MRPPPLRDRDAIDLTHLAVPTPTAATGDDAVWIGLPVGPGGEIVLRRAR